ncbi:Zn(2)-C6 fungal-type domain-containing protein [Mycena sanguinolenta]|uniref:Zn(2)-C6 fungal-type domain-containing protein n=1 Tax=Mycena sanguinolenta TaxID=230812 RepID=A0A8H6XLP9_9AGAR|nr:Zn(2)-C6 fungal-type domain-containing protein [Mycena sanguinolenta]
MAANGDPPVPAAKKRRVQRACDLCRQKRKACDGLRMSEKKCTGCIEGGTPCTFAGTVARRRGYVDALEARLHSTEEMLRKLANESGSNAPADGSEGSPRSGDSSYQVDEPTVSGSAGPGVILAALNLRSMNTPAPAPHSDDLAHLKLTHDLEALSIKHFSTGFQGKSSGAMLVKAAVQMKRGYEDKDSLPWTSRRMRYWTYNPAKHRIPHVGPFVFPDHDLLSALIDIYFTQINLYYPILHRPTFERNVADGLHLRDVPFGAVVLLVCANASRYSVDVRLQVEAEPLRRGWNFFDQLPPYSEHLFETPTVHHLQYYCRRSYNTPPPAACWTLIGIGLRLAQDAGAHRQMEGGPTVESELWKRGFWVLVAFDRQISMALGRPCTSQYEDVDADLLIECDDEYWENEEDPARAFVQPAGKPSLCTFFNCYLRLNNIFGVGLNMLYSLTKTKRLLAYRDHAWEQHIVAEVDSALNGWIDRIPPHLRWDPNRRGRDNAFFDQAAFLYCSYYQVQITIHRPFIPMTRDAAPTSLPSLGICTNAARSCSHVADISRIRKKGVPVPVLISSVFTSGLILLLNVWSGKRTGLPPHMNSAITEVHKCMATVRVCEKMWQTAGLCYDLLHELATLGQLPLPKDVTPSPHSSPPNPIKRAWSDDGDFEYETQYPALVHHPPPESANVYHPPPGTAHQTLPPQTHPEHQPLAVAGAPVVNNTPHPSPPSTHTQGYQFGAPLPTYTADLGKLPVFHPRAPPPPPQQGGPSTSMGGGMGVSSWYPTQSAAPFGRPELRDGGRRGSGGVAG